MRRSRIESTDSVSLKLSDTPRSWLSSNMVCASCRAEAIEVRKSVLSAGPCVGSVRSNPAAGASPRSTRTVLERPVGSARILRHLRHPLQFHIAALQNLDHLWIEPRARPSL